MRWLKRLLWTAGIYLMLDAVYVVKSADGIDLLPPSFGHHGWMFVGSDWAIAKIEHIRHPVTIVPRR
jgi:hypothetical protein